MSEEPQAQEHELTDAELLQAQRREFVNALRACTPKERALIRALPQYGNQIWRAAEKLGYSKRAVQLMVRRPRFQRVRATLAAITGIGTAIDQMSVVTELQRLGHSNLKDFYDANGELIPPQLWTEDMGAVVAERSFDERGRPKIKLHDKKGALDAAAKLLRMMPNRIELTAKDGEPLIPPQPVLNVVIAAKPEKEPEGK